MTFTFAGAGRHAIVTGGAGFVGSNLVRALVERGVHVTVLDNLSSGQRGALPTTSLVRFRFHDVARPLPDCERADVIFHLASPAVPAAYLDDPDAALDANDLGTREAIRRATRDGATLVYASSSEVYGDIEPRDESGIEEGQPARVHLAQDRNCYSEAKRFGEELVRAAVRKRGLDGRIVRLFNVYGPGMDRAGAARVVPTFVRCALAGKPLPISGDGLQTRSFCWIDDVVDALLRIGFMPSLGGLLVNIGNPEMTTIADLALSVQELLGRTGTVRHARDPYEPHWRKPNIARAQAVLHWSPTLALREGLPRVIAAMRLERPALSGIGVVVPTWSRPERLRRLIAALDDLVEKPVEVIVVDDASPGGVPEWLHTWAHQARYSARVLRQPRNRGPAAARNLGVAALATELVAFTDDDCEPATNWITALRAAFERSALPIAGIGGRVTARCGDIVSRYYVQQRILEPPGDTSYLVTANACFRRDLVAAVGGFDERIRQAGGEDPGLCFSLAREGFRFDFAREAIVAHDFRASVVDLARTFHRYGRGCFHVLHSAR